MKPNEGKNDRLIRVVLGIILLLGFFYLRGAGGIILGIVGLILLVTGATGFCGLYALLRISTAKEKKGQN